MVNVLPARSRIQKTRHPWSGVREQLPARESSQQTGAMRKAFLHLQRYSVIDRRPDVGRIVGHAQKLRKRPQQLQLCYRGGGERTAGSVLLEWIGYRLEERIPEAEVGGVQIIDGERHSEFRTFAAGVGRFEYQVGPEGALHAQTPLLRVADGRVAQYGGEALADTAEQAGRSAQRLGDAPGKRIAQHSCRRQATVRRGEKAGGR